QGGVHRVEDDARRSRLGGHDADFTSTGPFPSDARGRPIRHDCGSDAVRFTSRCASCQHTTMMLKPVSMRSLRPSDNTTLIMLSGKCGGKEMPRNVPLMDAMSPALYDGSAVTVAAHLETSGLLKNTSTWPPI